MKSLGVTLNEDENPPGRSGIDGALEVAVSWPFESWAAAQSDGAIQLDSCRRFERILVRTRHSVYELIVLGRGGCVFVRGGHAFPEFRRARVAGSSLGSALMLRSVGVGRRMELQADGKYFVTSTIQALSRTDETGRLDPISP